MPLALLYYYILSWYSIIWLEQCRNHPKRPIYESRYQKNTRNILSPWFSKTDQNNASKFIHLKLLLTCSQVLLWAMFIFPPNFEIVDGKSTHIHIVDSILLFRPLTKNAFKLSKLLKTHSIFSLKILWIWPSDLKNYQFLQTSKYCWRLVRGQKNQTQSNV